MTYVAKNIMWLNILVAHMLSMNLSGFSMRLGGQDFMWLSFYMAIILRGKLHNK